MEETGRRGNRRRDKLSGMKWREWRRGMENTEERETEKEKRTEGEKGM